MRDIPFGRPLIDDEERAAVLKVLNGPTLVHGPVAKEFEQAFAAFTEAPHALAVSSCTAGMHLAYMAIGLSVDDEVIVPAQTHAATAHAVEFCGAKAVFVDVEASSGNIDPVQVEAAVTSRTKAIAVVHYLGLPVDMAEISRIAGKHGLFVLEDCALGIGSRYQGTHVGLLGDVGCYSFYPVKHMTTAEGGMVITRDAQLAEKISRLRAFGVDRHHGQRAHPGMYDVTMLGYNYRMNEIEAAIGIEQVKKLPAILRARERNFGSLTFALAQIDGITQFAPPPDDRVSSFYCLSVLLEQSLRKKRWEIVDFLNRNGIGTSVYYPRPVSMMTYYREKYGYSEKDYPIAYDISEATISLPVGPHLSGDDMIYVAKKVSEAVEAVR